MLTADNILNLLRQKHREDVFVPECKGGPTWGTGHSRLDAWAMKKSWAHPLVWGYEIKVSRSDFLGDQKWHSYLPYCNEFYFVCPGKLIDPSELPAEAGLLWVASTGRQLMKKKASARRDVEVPEELYRYLLMSRVQIIDERDPLKACKQTREERVVYWREWLENHRENKRLGYRVSRELREHVEQVESDNQRLKAENNALALFKQRLDELGVNPNQTINEWRVNSALSQLMGDIPPYFGRQVEDTLRSLGRISEFLKEHTP
jgi:hypothetical protein